MEDSPVAFSPLRLCWVRNSRHRDRWQAEHDTYGFENPQATVGQSAERDQKISAWCLLHQKKHTEFDGVPAEACTISLYLNREYLGEVTAVI
jgi:hypothetical protein